jgi:hypothetical protein
MNIRRSLMVLVTLLFGVPFSISPALAVYTERLELSEGKASELPGAGVTLTFKTPDGTAVPVQTQSDDDHAVFVALPGDGASGGTLTVSRPGKPDTDIAIPAHGPNDAVVVDLDKGTATLKPMTPPTQTASPQETAPPQTAIPSPNFFAIGGDYEFLNVPGTGFGVVIDGTDERYAGRTRSHITAPSVGGALGFGLGYPGWRGELLVDYAHGSGSSNTAIDAGGVNTGIVFSDFSPMDTTGVLFGNAGIDVQTRTNAHNLTLMGKALWDWCDDDPDFTWDGYFGFEYQNIGVRQWGYLDTPTYGSDISQETWQRYTDRRYGALFGAVGHYTPDRANMPGFAADIFGGVELLYSHASLHSMQENYCTLCGTGYPFDIDIHDSQNKFGWGARAGIGLSQQIADNIRIGLIGDVHYVNKAAAVFNPETGDDLYIRNKPTQLTTKSTIDEGLHAYVSFGF